MKRSLFFVLLSLCLVSPGMAQISPDSLVSKDSLIKDFYDLKKTILDSHPNPFGFCTQEEFNEAFSSGARKLEQDMYMKDFVTLVEQTLLVMKDSHSCIDYNYLQELRMRNKGTYAPLRFVSMTGGVYVEKDREQLLQPGYKVLSVAGTGSFDWFQRSLKLACIEGNATPGKHRVAEALMPSVISLYNDLGSAVEVVLENPVTGAIDTVMYPTFTKDAWDDRQEKLEKEAFSEQNNFRIEGDSLGVLKIGSFAPSNISKYQRLIKNSFKELNEKKIPNLIIDLRDNGGGSSALVEYLYAYLDTAGYNTPHNIIAKTSELSNTRNKLNKKPLARWALKYFFKDNEDIQTFLSLAQRPIGSMDTVYFTQAKKYSEDMVYKDNVFLLINGLSASASVDFTNAFKIKGRGVIVGEPCLGPVSGTWGNPTVYTLKRTNIRVSIATIRYNYNDSFTYESQPIRPDVELKTTPLQLMEGVDAQVQYVRLHLKK